MMQIYANNYVIKTHYYLIYVNYVFLLWNDSIVFDNRARQLI